MVRYMENYKQCNDPLKLVITFTKKFGGRANFGLFYRICISSIIYVLVFWYLYFHSISTPLMRCASKKGKMYRMIGRSILV